MRTAFSRLARLSPALFLGLGLNACGGSSGHGGLGFTSSDASLSALVTSVGSLNPAFAPGTTMYTATAGSSTTSVTVTPTATNPASTITVNGTPVASGSESGPIPLAPNPTPTPITINVTAPDNVTTRTYTIVYTRASVASQEAYVKASNAEAGDAFGTRVAIAGDTLVVGAPAEDSNAIGVGGTQSDNSAPDSGAVYVYLRTGTTWALQAYLKASNTGGGDRFGSSVAISGDTIVVGARLEASNATGVGGNQADNSATAAGAAYVFVRSAGTWTQQAYLKASNTDVQDQFGTVVAISGDTVVVGAANEDSNTTGINGVGANESSPDSGAAYVFLRIGTLWAQQAYLKASNTGLGDKFGNDVSISGNTLVVGAPNEDSNATGIGGLESDNSVIESGAAYVFVRGGTVWTQQAYLKASNTGTQDLFGSAVAISIDTVVVGAPGEASGASGVGASQVDNTSLGAGAAYVFVRSGIAWTQQEYLKASNAQTGDNFGSSVAIAIDSIVVGAPNEDSNATGINGLQSDNSLTSAGAAYLFTRTGAVWTQLAYLKASNTGGQDRFGGSVSISGDTTVVGADGEDSNATNVGGVQSDNSAIDSGAVYVLRS